MLASIVKGWWRFTFWWALEWHTTRILFRRRPRNRIVVIPEGKMFREFKADERNN